MVNISKFSNPKRYIPDYRKSISHEQIYMREANSQGYVKGELYDELYNEYSKLTLTKIIKKRAYKLLEDYAWQFIALVVIVFWSLFFLLCKSV